MNQALRIGIVILLSMVAAPAIAEEPKLNLSTWQHIPVLHRGRVMPLDTFARVSAEAICDRVNPTLEFDGQQRRFSAPELLLSWLSEPAKWEEAPFLIAEHDELRKLLDVPVTGPDGAHLKYVSPATVADSSRLQEVLEQISRKRRPASMEESPQKLSNLETKASELWEAFTLYRQITFDPTSDETPRTHFLRVAADVLERWGKLNEELFILRQRSELNDVITKTDNALTAIAKGAGRGRFMLAAVEPNVVIAIDGIRELSTATGEMKDRLHAAKPGEIPGFDATQLDSIQTRLNRLAAAMRLLSKQANEMLGALYDNGDALRVTPSLNAAALDKDRDTDDEAQPWLTLQAVMYGSPELLKGYPKPQVSAVRATFARLKAAYVNQQTSDRPAAVTTASAEFADALRTLGEMTTALRDKLDIAGRDEDLMKYTAYPAAGATDTEVTYNRTDPFKWSWVLSLTAFFAFCLAFGVARKPMFWVGAAVLIAGLLWTIYGFALRVMVTKWAPVTNMYETVVYVPFFVSLLGAWFMLLPITWPGLKRAWKLTAVPGTWETSSDDDETPPYKFGLIPLAALVGRAALMVLAFQILSIKPYSAGGRAIINLRPVVDEGAWLPNANSLVVWLVGLCVLLPTVWYLPRVIVTLVMGVFEVARMLLTRGSALVQGAYDRKPFGLAATFAAFFGAFIAWYSPVLDENFTPLQPVLRDNFWLTIHVITIVSSYGAGMLAWGLGNLALGYYLLGHYRKRELHLAPSSLPAGYRPAAGEVAVHPTGKLPPEACHTLAGFIYKTFQVAVLLLAAGTILGGLWADVSWGRFWGWDPKEVWALISLLVYLAILHGRYAGMFGDFGLAVGSVLGATAVVFSWYGVNFYLGVGLHSYGFGTGGQWEVLGGVIANWLFMGAAAIRYRWETRGNNPQPEPPAETRKSERIATPV
jgi:ABC-type transport system involved in cytochrome c biogenesis permease subunit